MTRCAYCAISLIFLSINVTCAALGERGSSGEKGKRTWKLVLVRVIVNDLLFILEAVLLAAVLLLLTRHPRSFTPYLMSKVSTGPLKIIRNHVGLYRYSMSLTY